MKKVWLALAPILLSSPTLNAVDVQRKLKPLQASVSAQKKVDTRLGTDLPITRDNLIQIESYDPDSKVYEIDAPSFPGEGESYVTPQGLAKGIKTIDLKRILKDPESIVGQQFKTDFDLPTLTDAELESRKPVHGHK